MAVNCGKCGMSLPRSAMDDPNFKCSNCEQIAHAREALMLLAQASAAKPWKLLFITSRSAGGYGTGSSVGISTQLVDFASRDEAERVLASTRDMKGAEINPHNVSVVRLYT